MVEPETAGNPCTGEKWVRSRLRGLSAALNHRACPTTIGRLLREQEYGLRSHRKVLHKGKPHAERDRQFRHIAAQREAFRSTGDPRISVDAKKKECVATSADAPDLAVDSIVDWWRLHQADYPQAKRLMVEADSGGSNGARSRRFKKRLQDFADESRLEITVCHYPPGTSKWNPLEHRLFSQITATWAGYVLRTLAVLLGFLRRTTTRTGLKVTATHFEKTYATGQRVSKAEFKAIPLTQHTTCPQWNYTIRPRASPDTTK